MSSGSSYITGGDGIISVSVRSVIFLDLLHVYTFAKFITPITNTPTNRVRTNVRTIGTAK